MARIYDVVCPRCGEVTRWCKYDPPIEKCDLCGCKLSRRDSRGEQYWKDDVIIFDVGSTSLEVREESKKRRIEFFSDGKRLRFRLWNGLWCTVRMREYPIFELRFRIKGRTLILLYEEAYLSDAVYFLKEHGVASLTGLEAIEYNGKKYPPNKKEILRSIMHNEIPEVLALIK